MAKAREIPGIGCQTPFREAAVRAVEVRADELLTLSAGVLDSEDVERVHDMRVATRRLRAAMEVFSACYPPKHLKRALSDVKALADALGERRDPDVMIDGLEKVARKLAAGDRSGIRNLEEALGERQAGANERLARMLDRIEADRLRERLLALAAEARLG